MNHYYTPDGEIGYVTEQPYHGHGVEVETTEIYTADGLIQVIPISFRAIPYDEGGGIIFTPDSDAGPGEIKAKIAKGEFIMRPESFRDPLANAAAAFKVASERLGELGGSLRDVSATFTPKFATGGVIRGRRAPAPPDDDDPDDDYPAPPPVWDW